MKKVVDIMISGFKPIVGLGFKATELFKISTCLNFYHNSYNPFLKHHFYIHSIMEKCDLFKANPLMDLVAHGHHL